MGRRPGRYAWMLLLAALLLAACDPARGSATATRTATAPSTLAGGGACVALGARPAPPYRNVRVSDDSYTAHSEPMVAEDPANPLHLVGGSKFFTDNAHYLFKIGTYASFDGGCTWQDGGLLPGYDAMRRTSDPTFAFGPHGEVYAAVLFERERLSGIGVSRSDDGGRTFGQPAIVYQDATGAIFSDKPWIAVDRTAGPHTGAVYVAWSYDLGDGCNTCMGELGLSRSTDGGRTFSPVQRVEGSAPFCTYPADGRPANSTRCDGALGATPEVLPDGTVAIAFGYFAAYGDNPTRMLIITSRDGGATWSEPTLVATIHDVPGHFRGERYRVVSLPAFAADPRTGQLYLAWADTAHGDADILLTTSRDAGATWSAPVRVNDDSVGDGANQFQPQLAVAPDGVVSVSYFDTRNDPAHHLIDVYLSQSLNHGATFLPSVRVTPRGWDPNVGAPQDEGGSLFIGDYQGLAADDEFAHPFWNDTSYGSQQIVTAAAPSAQPAAAGA